MKNILFIIALVAVLLSAQFGFCALINLETPAASGTVEGKAAVDKIVKDEGDKLASNAALVNTNLELLGQITNESKISLDMTVLANVKDPTGYALTLAMVGRTKIAAVGTTEDPSYVITESPIRPIIFAAAQVINNPGVFAQAIDGLKENQIGVVLSGNAAERMAVEKLPEFQNGLKAGKVVLPPVALTSNALLTALLEEANMNPAGVSLSDALLKPAVVSAIQGAV